MEKHLRVNNLIRSPEVRLIDDQGQQLGVVTILEAFKIARERNLDLVEVGPTAQPPIAKIMDYGKYIYQQERQSKKSGVKPKSQELKTVRVGFKTGMHDLQFKANKIDEFLGEGHPVKVELTLRGREKGVAHIGQQKLKQFLTLPKTPFTTQGAPSRSPYGWVVMINKDNKKVTS